MNGDAGYMPEWQMPSMGLMATAWRIRLQPHDFAKDLAEYSRRENAWRLLTAAEAEAAATNTTATSSAVRGTIAKQALAEPESLSAAAAHAVETESVGVQASPDVAESGDQTDNAPETSLLRRRSDEPVVMRVPVERYPRRRPLRDVPGAAPRWAARNEGVMFA